MNVIFSVILLLSFIILSVFNPDGVFTAISSASNKSINLSVTLLSVYSVWLGFTNLISASNLSDKISKLLKPLIAKLFNTKNPNVIKEISLNLSANLLGLGGVATPSGINAMAMLDRDKNEKGKTMLFVITATSIQIFPLSVMALMTEYGSIAPYMVFLPTLITTVISTATGVILTLIFK